MRSSSEQYYKIDLIRCLLCLKIYGFSKNVLFMYYMNIHYKHGYFNLNNGRIEICGSSSIGFREVFIIFNITR